MIVLFQRPLNGRKLFEGSYAESRFSWILNIANVMKIGWVKYRIWRLHCWKRTWYFSLCKKRTRKGGVAIQLCVLGLSIALKIKKEQKQ